MVNVGRSFQELIEHANNVDMKQEFHTMFVEKKARKVSCYSCSFTRGPVPLLLVY